MFSCKQTANGGNAFQRPTRAFLRLGRLVLFASLGATLFHGSGTDMMAQAQNYQEKRVVRSIVKSVADTSGVDRSLKVLGFPPENFLKRETWRSYRRWPDIRKLEGAYHAAEASASGAGGKLLNDMLWLTAGENLAIVDDPVFKRNIGKVSSDDLRKFQPKRFTFALPTADQFKIPLPKRMEDIVRAVIRHAWHIPGGMSSLARVCCGLNSDAVYKKMRTAETYEEVVAWALQEGEIPPELQKRLQNLVKHGLKHNAALAYDEALRVAAEELRTIRKSTVEARTMTKLLDENDVTVLHGTTAEVALARVVQRAGGGKLPKSVELLTQGLRGGLTSESTFARPSARIATQQFAAFQAREYKVLPSGPGRGNRRSSNALNFAKVKVRARGFGGVVLGDDVTAQAGLPIPLRFKWRTLDDNIKEARSLDSKFTWGYLVISFEDESVGVTVPMRARHVWSAATIVYTGVEGVVDPLDVGDGIDGEAAGLAGFVGARDYSFLEDGEVKKVANGARAFVLHPAILGYPLANDALLVDAVPFAFPRSLEDMVKTQIDQRGEIASGKVWEMFKTWLRDDDRSTYKFVDTPLTIMRTNSGVMYAVRTESPTSGPLSLRNRAFLTFQKFDLNGTPSQEESPPFYPLVPLLTEAWPNFERLNDFAEVLAFFRWLRAKNAQWEVGLKEPQRGPALTTLVAMDNDQPSLARSLFEINHSLAKRVQRLASTLLEDAPRSLIDLDEKIHQARVERLAAREAQQIWDEEAIANDFSTTLSNIRQEVSFLEEARRSPLLRRLLFQEAGDLITEDSDADLQSVIGSRLKELRKELEETEGQLSQTDEGKFLEELKEIEREAAERSPIKDEVLSKLHGIFVERQKAKEERDQFSFQTDEEKFVEKLGEIARDAAESGSINDEGLEKFYGVFVEWQKIREEQEQLSKRLELLNALLFDGNEVKEEVLLRWVATEVEQTEIAKADDQITALNSEILNDTTGWFRVLSEWWYRDRIQSNRDERNRIQSNRADLIAELQKRWPEVGIDLRNKVRVLADRSQKLAGDAEKEIESLAAKFTFPTFKDWYTLQYSYRVAVFEQ